MRQYYELFPHIEEQLVASLVVEWHQMGHLGPEVTEEFGERSPHMWVDPVRHKRGKRLLCKQKKTNNNKALIMH